MNDPDWMQTEILTEEEKSAPVNCTCGWQGTVRDLRCHRGLSGQIKVLYCPNCQMTIATTE